MDTIISKIKWNNEDKVNSDSDDSKGSKDSKDSKDNNYSKNNKEYIDEILNKAGEFIRNGELVAFPTETVYGLGGNAYDKNASKKIYEAKGRPSDNPLIVHVCNMNQVEDVAENISDEAYELMDRFWPGPMTVILNKKDIVPDETTGGLKTVAVRMPDNPIALGLIEKAGVPIAAPSANTSGRPSPTLAKHVEDDLSGKIAMILDGGEVGIGIESTIVDMTEEKPVILRPGYISKTMLEDVVTGVETDKGLVDENVAPKAPGMKYRHYAPKGEFTLYKGEPDKVVNAINSEIEKLLASNSNKEEVSTDEIVESPIGDVESSIGDNEKLSVGRKLKIAVICSDETRDKYTWNDECCKVISLGSRREMNSISHNLYRVLRDLDDMGIQYIFGEVFFREGLGDAVMNRMLKAAGHNIVET